MEKYTKINDKEVEIEVVKSITEKTIYSLDQLVYQRDSLVRNIQENLDDVTNRNAEIQSMVDTLNLQIAEFRNLGVKLDVEIPKGDVLEEVNNGINN